MGGAFLPFTAQADGAAGVDAVIVQRDDLVPSSRDVGWRDHPWSDVPEQWASTQSCRCGLRRLGGTNGQTSLGTGVQPIQLRQPMSLAQAALTLNLVGGGRFRLGIGLTHALVCDGMWGVPWDRPARRLNEYLDGLQPLLVGDQADVTGEIYTTRGTVGIAGADAPPVYVAAMGPQLLRIAGRRTAGTITFMTGPRTLANHVVPTLRAAAEEAGREAEVVAALPICVTDDVTKVRELAAETYALYGTLPSYQAMLDREGVDGPADVALIGDEDAVGAQLDEIRAAGVAEFAAHVFGSGDEERARTRALLGRARPV